MQPDYFPSNTIASRAMDDFIAQERRARERAERELSSCYDLLAEIATRLDGENFEAIRRENPRAPGSWGASDWRSYLIPATDRVAFRLIRWNAPQSASTELQDEVARLRKLLAEANAQLVQQKSKPVAQSIQAAPRPQVSLSAGEPRNPAAIQSQPKPALVVTSPAPAAVAAENSAPPIISKNCIVPPFMEMADRVRAFLKNPPAIPSGPKGAPADRQYKALGEEGRPWHKYAATVFMVGALGISATAELQSLISFAIGDVKPSSSSIRKLFDVMFEQFGCFYVETLAVSGVRVKLLRLTPVGVALYKAMTGADPVESEWERLIRLHRGDDDTSHAAACVIFGFQARWRGYHTNLLPVLDDAGKARPDYLIEKDGERIAVEVELSSKDDIAKWRNLAAINGGKVAICARTAARRERLGGDCRLAKIPGMATDIERFKAIPYGDEDHTSPLWTEIWT